MRANDGYAQSFITGLMHALTDNKQVAYINLGCCSTKKQQEN